MRMCGMPLKLTRHAFRLTHRVSQMVEGADTRAFLRMHPPPSEGGTVYCVSQDNILCIKGTFMSTWD